MITLYRLLVGLCACIPPGFACAAEALEVYPPSMVLNGPRDQQRVGVLSAVNGRQIDLTGKARLTSGDLRIARLDGDTVRPVGNGTTVITIEIGGKSATIPVTVKQAAAEAPTSFVREVAPVLTKAGCNQGACHGAQHGRGGFRLSLFGFDPAFDHSQIVQSAEGRRVVVSDPERSILLLKPTLTMEHGGGERIKPNSREYQILKRWLEDGAPEPAANDVTVTKIDVWPAKRLLKAGDRQQLLVTATWSDGRREDVTATARFDALNDSVAAVTPDGLVTAKSRGETHIMVRFGGQASVAQITLPYQDRGDKSRGAQAASFVTNNFIDAKLRAKWQDLGLAPSPAGNDAEFFRRIHLDAIGTLPAPDDVRKFLADKDSTKRDKAIDAVLNRPEFVDFWAYKWGDLLRINRTALEEKGMWSFHNWVRAALRDNKPVDEIVRDIILAEGSTFTEGPANFYRIARTPEEWSETVAQVFLGVRLQCAKCHHHPFEKWSQEDYYGMTAFFVRLGTKNSQEFGIFGRETVVYLRSSGEATHPRKRGVVKPHPLDGAECDDPLDRRVKLAEWLTSKDNSLFARNIVNRFWGYLMGRGLVEPLDDLRATNPASNPELLDALAADFASHKFDLKHLLRTIMRSRAYQLSSKITDENRADVTNVHFTRYTVKRLTAEQVADGIDYATGTRQKYQGLPLGMRAIQLPDPVINSYLMDVFGRPARQVVCECERTTKPNIAQALHTLNGDFLNKKIADPSGRVALLLKDKTPVPAIVEDLYLATLSRPPREEELAKVHDYLGAAPTAEALQDLLWVLLNSREFLFNH